MKSKIQMPNEYSVRNIIQSTKVATVFSLRSQNDFSLKHLFHLSQHFLNKYVDDAITGRHTHRMSTTEDDNPPSPMDSIDIFSLSSQPPSTGSPASRQRGETGLRFPMTPPSNPHTPASPSAARMSGVSVFSLRHFLVCVLKMCKKSKSVSYLYRSMME